MKNWLGLLSGVLVAANAGAGTVVHFASKSPGGQQHDHEVYYAQAGMLRIDHLDQDGHVQDTTLVKDGKIWHIDAAQKTYMKFDNAAMQAKMAGMNDQMKQMLASLPPDKRAAIEARMQGMTGGGPAFEFTDTGKSDHSGQYSCEVWSATRAGKEIAQHCLVPPASLTGGAELADAFQKALPAVEAALQGTLLAPAAETFEQFKKANGFPVRTVHMAGGKESSEDFVTSVETQSLAADKFSIPAGFTEKTMAQ